LKTSNQISGRHLTHCGFTTGASYCSFRCTHCYLPENANRVPIPSLAQMKEQIDANRRLQGPDGGLQITGGDVADAYFKSGRQDELVDIVRYAVVVGLVPMLMTHGQTLIEHPEFMEKLVVQGGLRQVAIHIDRTQAGRRGYPIGHIKAEADLHPVRQAFTKLALYLRKKTGLRLELAHNCTVTGKNIEDVPEIIRWFLAEPERTRFWRYISFQPEADTGRTVFSERQVTPKLVWEKICEGVGLNLEEHAFIAGHPDCNHYATLLVTRLSGRVLPLVPADGKSRALFAEMLARLGAFSTITTDEAGTLTYRLAGALIRHPGLATRTLAQAAALVSSRVVPFEFVRALVSGQLHTVNIGMHNFMDAACVANAASDPVTRARLEACVFKGAVKNHATGEWEAVPMCKMNQQRWSELYSERLNDPTLVSATGRSEVHISAGG
jgi:MoaA/NifB/PqqE/SkfB family radical SAM enzyme